MTVDTEQAEPPKVGKAGRIERMKRILLEPKAEWERIDVEQTTIGAIFRNWVLYLAAIPALANLVGSLAFGYSFLGITYRPSPVEAISSAILRYVLSVAGIYLMALLIDALAPQFGGTRSRLQAVKVAAYSATAAWIAGIFGLIPSLAVLGIIGLYSLYLLYLGLPRLMKVAEDKAIAYIAVTIVAALVLALIVGLVVAPLTMLVAGPAATTPAGTVTVPGGGTLDLGKLGEVSRQVQQGSARPALAPASLQALLPASLGAYRRTELSSAGASAGGIGGAEAEATYENGDSHIRLQVTDMAVAGAIAALGSALNVESSSQTANGYEKSGNVDGRMTNEKWNNVSHDGSFGVVVGNRFMVEAEGKVPSVDTLKQAVNAVGIERLEAIAARH